MKHASTADALGTVSVSLLRGLIIHLDVETIFLLRVDLLQTLSCKLAVALAFESLSQMETVFRTLWVVVPSLVDTLVL